MLIQIAGFVSSIVVAVVSYIFGTRSNVKLHKLQNDEKRYEQFYSKLIVMMTHWKIDDINYYRVVGAWKFLDAWKKQPQHKSEFFLLIQNNIQYLPETIGKEAYQFLRNSGNDDFFYDQNDKTGPNYEHFAKTASNEFDKIIPACLIEAARLSKELGYPDIASPFLQEFETSLAKHPDKRYLN